MLGETLLAAAMALEKAASGHFDIALLHIALSALVIMFSMWWLYFSAEDHLGEQSRSAAFAWGYGHVVIFLGGAAVGAGFAVLVDIVTDHAKTSLLVGNYVVAVSVAMYLFGLWFVRDRFALSETMHTVLLIFAGLILLAPPLLGLEGVAGLTLLAVLVRSRVAASLKPASV